MLNMSAKKQPDGRYKIVLTLENGDEHIKYVDKKELVTRQMSKMVKELKL